ncbi:helix-turn-helix domain-containing protein [Lachnoclostridium sp. Marseille-P6806]|uniref:helix-turn-helix domain-containing protein n=1 Tax=Lachnoclostridium sp. Marseille-P6806 TaxID=2364793 RepID=UPI00102F72CE|nr:AraC family transcriptional regulator [Lachnoclostridium sp. Marseille-P6806]
MEEKSIWEDFIHFGEIGEFRLIADSEDCIVLRVENDTGEGDMIIYPVFDGIYLMYNDFHMAHYDSMYQAAETVLAVDYCREGSLIMECDNGFYQMKKSGNVCVDSRVHHKGVARFPASHFHGITIGFESPIAEKALTKEAPGIEIDLMTVRDKYCGKDGFSILKDNETLRRIFTDLYQVPERARQNYFRTKILELLVCLSALEKSGTKEEHTYFYRDQVEKTTVAMKLMTEDLRQSYTIEKLSDRFGLSATALKDCFKSMYGKPIYTWLKEYRIQTACELLMTQPEKSIGDIAFEVGYDSAGKFSGAFKKICGMTPKEYRNQPY